ncbi:hypothetical protein [Pseudomonas typographi]|uniref:Uncharacterized protein n=1 Tax=Pseudomonas typographi TaxID=2715964 RepID=A0ABR7YXK1_9PSED|nr:hypothetical protein [Pseudomonas typographi]MBD1551006.1 hypothetical protein [Pseudomonas typographi]MBD1587920.1 hypothetical protein [Pseudomonas typographi]MBD1597908.1 hypothetical protein [Pseudomonas typographi]
MTRIFAPKVRKLTHRRMALAALRANSSRSVLLTRYNDQMARPHAVAFASMANSKMPIEKVRETPHLGTASATAYAELIEALLAKAGGQ